MLAEAAQHPETHLQEAQHLYTKDQHLLQTQEYQEAHTTAALTALEEVPRADTQEIHTTETVLHQAPATLAAAHLHQVDSHVEAQVSLEGHHMVATAEVHQEVIDDKNIKT